MFTCSSTYFSWCSGRQCGRLACQCCCCPGVLPLVNPTPCSGWPPPLTSYLQRFMEELDSVCVVSLMSQARGPWCGVNHPACITRPIVAISLASVGPWLLPHFSLALNTSAGLCLIPSLCPAYKCRSVCRHSTPQSLLSILGAHLCTSWLIM